MRTKTKAQVQADLQILANQFGAKGFDAAKADYFSRNSVEDDAGNLIDPATLDLQIEFTKSETLTETKATDISDTVKKAVAEAVASLPRGESKAVRIEAVGDDRRKGIARGTSKSFKNPETAYGFGRWIQAVTFGNRAPGAVKYCKDNGLALRFGDFDHADSDLFVEKAITGHSEAVNADGGFLVPLQFDTELVWLREQYGVFRKYAQFKSMSTDRLEFLRKDSSHTASFVGEGVTNSTSKMGFVRLGLTARKLRADGYLTEELSEDAAINVGDEAARDIVEQFALKEDQCGFNGDGTATYGGIVGLTQKFLGLGTVSNSVGIYDAAAASYAALAIADIMAWRAKLPAYADGPNCRIFCHKVFYHTVLERLAVTAGGSTIVDMASGITNASFLGTPVVFCQALPATPTANVPDAFYGDLSKCATFGSRRGITFKTTDTGGSAWENDEIAYKATERFDINVHDVGNNTATVADQKAGPVVALIAT